MILNEALQNWSNIINEEYGVKDQNKRSWMAQYARNHEIFESVQGGVPGVDAGIYATPLNTLGMGNPMMPQGVGFDKGAGIGNTGADFHNPLYKVGSGDIPMSTLSMSLEVAAMTIGLELVPVIPASGPWAMLSYMDFPYAGGKLGRINETAFDGKGEGNANKPIYIKVLGASVNAATKKANADKLVRGAEVKVGDFTGKFIGFSRIDNSIIAEVVSCKDANQSIAEAFEAATTVTIAGVSATVAGKLRADLVAGMADHVQGFANFATGDADPMTRAENETGTGNTIGARMFTKLVQMGAYEVTGTVTRQQLQDMPLYGVDVVGKVLEAMQNQISQEINNRILDRVFKLGVENWKTQRDYQGVDLNLYIGSTTATSKPLSSFGAYSRFVDLNGKRPASYDVPNAVKNTAAENVHTHQRRIMSRVLAASNLIANVSRYGRGNWIVTNTQILSALQDCAGFVYAPMANTLTQDGSQSIYFAGSLAGLNIYVDPFMTWEDTRICVGRKGDGKTPGVVFMPYILADTVQTVAEGTMAPKLLVNSRFAIVDAGFHPAQNYYTFMVDADSAYLL
jgi:hypothetical protein